MITIKQYFMGREKKYASELTATIKSNAEDLLMRVNKLLKEFGEDREVTSGWRPVAVNRQIPGAAKRSKHMLGLAIDLEDTDGSLDEWCLENLEKLEAFGLWQEHPSATKGWCHLQSMPYGSYVPGKPRWFYP